MQLGAGQSQSEIFGVPRALPDRSVPTPFTVSGDDRPTLSHHNCFAKLHAHDGVAGAWEGIATTVLTIGGARCSWRVTRNTGLLVRYLGAGRSD
jgi:hypothetical protein